MHSVASSRDLIPPTGGRRLRTYPRQRACDLWNQPRGGGSASAAERVHPRSYALSTTGMMDHSPYRAGSKEDFDRLYRTNYQRVFRTLVAITGDEPAAEDCTQEAFLSAFRVWEGWKADAPAEAWIYRIAINTAISYRRKQRLRDVGELIRRLGRPSDPDPTEPDLSPDMLREIKRLPTKQAAALVLRHLHGYTNREIAVALGVPESTIATRLMEARRALRRRLSGRQQSTDTSGWLRVPHRE